MMLFTSLHQLFNIFSLPMSTSLKSLFLMLFYFSGSQQAKQQLVTTSMGNSCIGYPGIQWIYDTFKVCSFLFKDIGFCNVLALDFVMVFIRSYLF